MFTSLYDRVIHLLRKIEWAGPLLVRLTLGLVFVTSGWGKLHSLDKVTEFFGFFSFSGKITAFAAPLAIGAVTHASGSQRIGIAMSLVFLIAGLLLLLRVKHDGR